MASPWRGGSAFSPPLKTSAAARRPAAPLPPLLAKVIAGRGCDYIPEEWGPVEVEEVHVSAASWGLGPPLSLMIATPIPGHVAERGVVPPLPIRLADNGPGVRPFAPVEPFVSRRSDATPDPQHAVKRRHRPEPAVEAEGELVEVCLEVRGADAVMCLEQSSVEVAEDNVDHGQVLVRLGVVVAHGDGLVSVAERTELVVADPSVRPYQRSPQPLLPP